MKKDIAEMSNFELSRWIGLFVAVNMIAEKCKKGKRDFNNVELSPIPIKGYINNTYMKYKTDLDKSSSHLRSLACLDGFIK